VDFTTHGHIGITKEDAHFHNSRGIISTKIRKVHWLRRAEFSANSLPVLDL